MNQFSKKKFIVANWKMTPATAKEAAELFNAAGRIAKKIRNVKIVICPPFVYLSALRVTRYELQLGAQDLFWEDEGSYTGEVSAKMLKNLNVQYVIIGHSERRRYLNETDEAVNKKIKAALQNNLKVIFCIGERERDEAGNYLQFVKEEAIKGLDKIPTKFLKNLIITYEPVWAISTANKSKKGYHPDTPEDAREMAMYIKRVLVSVFGKIAYNIPILYGGSVDAINAKDFLEKGGVEGLLVGRASWNAKSFEELLKSIS
jgi:triosephosphate isomerase